MVLLAKPQAATKKCSETYYIKSGNRKAKTSPYVKTLSPAAEKFIMRNSQAANTQQQNFIGFA